MSFIYPRVVSIARPNKTAETDVGDVGYNAERGAPDETVIAADLPASIQLDRQGQRNGVGLPTDAAYKPIWKLLIPAHAAALGLIESNDVCVDDLGIRYQVFAPYLNSLGYNARMIVLEV